MSIRGSQITAAIALSKANRKELADYAGISLATLSYIENDKSKGQPDALNKIKTYIENRGIEFLDHDGVRRKPSGEVRELKGIHGLREFYDDVYHVAASEGGSFCIFNGVPDLIINALGTEFYKSHAERMAKVQSNYKFKVIIEHGDTNFIGSDFVEYRWFPKESSNSKTIYIYADKVAFISWDTDPQILIIHQAEIAEGQRSMFFTAWNSAEKAVA